MPEAALDAHLPFQNSEAEVHRIRHATRLGQVREEMASEDGGGGGCSRQGTTNAGETITRFEARLKVGDGETSECWTLKEFPAVPAQS